jgi:hypothetical protein
MTITGRFPGVLSEPSSHLDPDAALRPFTDEEPKFIAQRGDLYSRKWTKRSGIVTERVGYRERTTVKHTADSVNRDRSKSAIIHGDTISELWLH